MRRAGRPLSGLRPRRAGPDARKARCDERGPFKGAPIAKSAAVAPMRKRLAAMSEVPIDGHSMRRAGAQWFTVAGVDPWMVAWYCVGARQQSARTLKMRGQTRHKQCCLQDMSAARGPQANVLGAVRRRGGLQQGHSGAAASTRQGAGGPAARSCCGQRRSPRSTTLRSAASTMKRFGSVATTWSPDIDSGGCVGACTHHHGAERCATGLGLGGDSMAGDSVQVAHLHSFVLSGQRGLCDPQRGCIA